MFSQDQMTERHLEVNRRNPPFFAPAFSLPKQTGLPFWGNIVCLGSSGVVDAKNPDR